MTLNLSSVLEGWRRACWGEGLSRGLRGASSTCAHVRALLLFLSSEHHVSPGCLLYRSRGMISTGLR